MHTLSDYEAAAFRVGKQIEDTLGKLRREAETEVRAEHHYKVSLEKAKAMLRIEHPGMPVKTQESDAFMTAEPAYLTWGLVQAEVAILKLELRAYMAKLDMLRTLISAHGKEAEFVQKER